MQEQRTRLRAEAAESLRQQTTLNNSLRAQLQMVQQQVQEANATADQARMDVDMVCQTLLSHTSCDHQTFCC